MARPQRLGSTVKAGSGSLKSRRLGDLAIFGQWLRPVSATRGRRVKTDERMR